MTCTFRCIFKSVECEAGRAINRFFKIRLCTVLRRLIYFVSDKRTCTNLFIRVPAALHLNTTHCGSAERIKRPSDFIHSDRRRLKAEELNKSKREKANELKQHNHLRFKTVKVSGVPLDKRNFLSSLCVAVPDSQVDELYPGGARARDCRTWTYF